MDISSVRHKGLRRYIEKGDARGLPAQSVAKIDIRLRTLEALRGIDDFLALPRWRPHALKGDRAGTYSISVTANLRMTFEHDPTENSIHILDLEDYY